MSRTTVLEKKLISALSDKIESRAVATLLLEAKTAIAETEAEVNRIAMDPIACPDANKARDMLEVADLDLKRLRSLLPKLEERFIQLQSDEQMTRWSNEYENLKAKHDAAARQFAAYPKLAAQLIDLLQQAEAIDRDVSNLHRQAPSGEYRRLLGVELTARGLQSFSCEQPSIAANLKLPDWTRSDRLAFPPPTIPASVLIAASATYAQSDHVPIAPPSPPPALVHSHTGDWWRENEVLKRQQHEEQSRVAKYYDAMARAREEREAAEEQARRRA